jgi:hypothetical protein
MVQIVKMGEEYSMESEVVYGVSQGTCLGPLLYILGVNDLPKVIKYGEVAMFADDTLISVAA